MLFTSASPGKHRPANDHKHMTAIKSPVPVEVVVSNQALLVGKEGLASQRCCAPKLAAGNLWALGPASATGTGVQVPYSGPM